MSGKTASRPPFLFIPHVLDEDRKVKFNQLGADLGIVFSQKPVAHSHAPAATANVVASARVWRMAGYSRSDGRVYLEIGAKPLSVLTRSMFNVVALAPMLSIYDGGRKNHELRRKADYLASKMNARANVTATLRLKHWLDHGVVSDTLEEYARRPVGTPVDKSVSKHLDVDLSPNSAAKRVPITSSVAFCNDAVYDIDPRAMAFAGATLGLTVVYGHFLFVKEMLFHDSGRIDFVDLTWSKFEQDGRTMIRFFFDGDCSSPYIHDWENYKSWCVGQLFHTGVGTLYMYVQFEMNFHGVQFFRCEFVDSSRVNRPLKSISVSRSFHFEYMRDKVVISGYKPVFTSDRGVVPARTLYLLDKKSYDQIVGFAQKLSNDSFNVNSVLSYAQSRVHQVVVTGAIVKVRELDVSSVELLWIVVNLYVYTMFNRNVSGSMVSVMVSDIKNVARSYGWRDGCAKALTTLWGFVRAVTGNLSAKEPDRVAGVGDVLRLKGEREADMGSVQSSHSSAITGDRGILARVAAYVSECFPAFKLDYSVTVYAAPNYAEFMSLVHGVGFSEAFVPAVSTPVYSDAEAAAFALSSVEGFLSGSKCADFKLVHVVPGDGLCFFHCLALRLGVPTSRTGEIVDRLKNRVTASSFIDYLRLSNSKDEILSADDPVSVLLERVRLLSVRTAWGASHVDMLYAAYVYEITICFHEGAVAGVPVINPGAANGVLHLSYDGKGHVDLLFNGKAPVGRLDTSVRPVETLVANMSGVYSSYYYVHGPRDEVARCLRSAQAYSLDGVSAVFPKVAVLKNVSSAVVAAKGWRVAPFDENDFSCYVYSLHRVPYYGYVGKRVVHGLVVHEYRKYFDVGDDYFREPYFTSSRVTDPDQLFMKLSSASVPTAADRAVTRDKPANAFRVWSNRGGFGCAAVDALSGRSSKLKPMLFTSVDGTVKFKNVKYDGFSLKNLWDAYSNWYRGAGVLELDLGFATPRDTFSKSYRACVACGHPGPCVAGSFYVFGDFTVLHYDGTCLVFVSDQPLPVEPVVDYHKPFLCVTEVGTVDQFYSGVDRLAVVSAVYGPSVVNFGSTVLSFLKLLSGDCPYETVTVEKSVSSCGTYVRFVSVVGTYYFLAGDADGVDGLVSLSADQPSSTGDDSTEPPLEYFGPRGRLPVVSAPAPGDSPVAALAAVFRRPSSLVRRVLSSRRRGADPVLPAVADAVVVDGPDPGVVVHADAPVPQPDLEPVQRPAFSVSIAAYRAFLKRRFSRRLTYGRFPIRRRRLTGHRPRFDVQPGPSGLLNLWSDTESVVSTFSLSSSDGHVSLPPNHVVVPFYYRMASTSEIPVPVLHSCQPLVRQSLGRPGCTAHRDGFRVDSTAVDEYVSHVSDYCLDCAIAVWDYYPVSVANPRVTFGAVTFSTLSEEEEYFCEFSPSQYVPGLETLTLTRVMSELVPGGGHVCPESVLRYETVSTGLFEECRADFDALLDCGEHVQAVLFLWSALTGNSVQLSVGEVTDRRCVVFGSDPPAFDVLVNTDGTCFLCADVEPSPMVPGRRSDYVVPVVGAVHGPSFVPSLSLLQSRLPGLTIRQNVLDDPADVCVIECDHTVCGSSVLPHPPCSRPVNLGLPELHCCYEGADRTAHVADLSFARTTCLLSHAVYDNDGEMPVVEHLRSFFGDVVDGVDPLWSDPTIFQWLASVLSVQFCVVYANDDVDSRAYVFGSGQGYHFKYVPCGQHYLCFSTPRCPDPLAVQDALSDYGNYLADSVNDLESSLIDLASSVDFSDVGKAFAVADQYFSLYRVVGGVSQCVLQPTARSLDITHAWSKTESAVVRVRAEDDRIKFPRDGEYLINARCLKAVDYMLAKVVPSRAPSALCVVGLCQGPPGIGKTYDLVSRFSASDLVVGSTRAGVAEIVSKMSTLKPDMKPIFPPCTIDSLLLRARDDSVQVFLSKTRRVYVDEALMMHSGKIAALVTFCPHARFLLYGDRLQIPFFSRSNRYRCRFSDAGWVPVAETKLLSFRCPVDVTATLYPLYLEHNGAGMFTCSSVERSMFLEFNTGSPASLPAWKGAVMCFTQLEKALLVKHFPDLRVGTVNEMQGCTFPEVLLVRFSARQSEEIFFRQSHCLVAISRHTKKLVYSMHRGLYDVYSDKLALVDLVAHWITSGDWRKFVDVVRSTPTSVSYRTETVDLPGPPAEVMIGRLEPVLLHPSFRTGSTEASRVLSDRFGYGGLQPFRAIRNYLNPKRPLPRAVVPRVEDPVSFLQDAAFQLWQDECFFEHGKNRLVDSDELNFDLVNVTFDLSSVSVPDDFKMVDGEYRRFTHRVNVQPLLKTPMPPKRNSSPAEVLYGYATRNCAASKLPEVKNVNSFAYFMLRSFVDLYVRDPVKRSLFLSYADCPIHPDAGNLADWQTSHGYSDTFVLRPFVGDLDVDSVANLSFEIKRAVKPKLGAGSTVDYAGTQTIASMAKWVNMVFSPVRKIMQERLNAVLDDHVFMFTDVDPQDLADVLSEYVPPSAVLRGDLVHCDYDVQSFCRMLEVDISKYDKSQQAVCLEFERLLYLALGCPKDLLAVWVAGHILKRLRSRDGLRATIFFQRNSGDMMTLFGNSVVQAAMHAVVQHGVHVDFLQSSDLVAPSEYFDYSGDISRVRDYTPTSFPNNAPDIRLFLFVGDDSLIYGSGICGRTAEFGALFSMEAKEDSSFDSIYFCSKFFLPAEGDRWALLADPVKTLMKLGRHDLVGRFHVDEYCRSLADLYSRVDDISCLPAASAALVERYPRLRDPEGFLCSLFTVVSDSSKFLRLYDCSVDPQPRVFSDHNNVFRLGYGVAKKYVSRLRSDPRGPLMKYYVTFEPCESPDEIVIVLPRGAPFDYIICGRNRPKIKKFKEGAD